MSAAVETLSFQAEAQQLLELMIHSVYSNKDIFLRELISNSSDALDRLRFEALTRPELTANHSEPHILIEADKDARTLAISDNGIGMTRQEVIDLIGTIAKSGTREYLKAVKARDKAAALEQIGQFGVGFYSAFMVADRVELITRKAGEAEATRWVSEGKGSYTIETADRAESGTTITLHLREADHEEALHDYTDEWVIKRIVKQYSDFVAYPVQMWTERKEVERDEDGKPKPDAKETVTRELQTLNSMKAIWLRETSEVTEEEYQEFYKHISHDWNEPMRRITAKMEGTLEYRMLLFIPSQAPFDLFHRDSHKGVQLYVKRVFIMDDCTELLPIYLRFIRGVVDCEDLSLNISREILQQNRQIQRMKNGITSQVLNTLKTLQTQEPEAYTKFWAQFGRVLKEGIFQDHDNQEVLLSLMRCDSTASETEPTTLDAYVDRMKPDQTAIYYITARSRRDAEHSPHIEAFKAQGYEVLLLTEPVDEVWVGSVFEYKGKKLQSAGKGAVDLGSEEERNAREAERKEKEKTYASLLDCLKGKLADNVKEVRLSNRLTESAACLVGDAHDMTPQLEQMMKALGQEMPQTKRILEINPNHPLVAKLQAAFDRNPEDSFLGDAAQLLFGQAMLAEGATLPDPALFSKLVADLMVKAI